MTFGAGMASNFFCQSDTQILFMHFEGRYIEQWPDFGCEGIKVQRAHQPTSFVKVNIQPTNIMLTYFSYLHHSNYLQITTKQYLCCYFICIQYNINLINQIITC
eukprot:TRINITY_DN21324_c0_g1_i2.p3 TRINITY_DN21324_c0_g1~~TRINITY_DN21324_c0_g1_i2.p3  ORF type:complete len:104 (-),score=1.12 TRINITY_DN21324_c0_g1_i2:593-904(-)